MDINEICKKIYDIVLPYADKFEAPIAYVDVILGIAASSSDIFPKKISKEELWEAYNKVKWNSPLATSELEVKESKSSTPFLQVMSVIEFEDEHGNAVSHAIPASIGTISL